MSVIDEIIEDMEKDKEIVKSFVPKDSLPNDIFDKKNDTFILKEDIRDKLLQISNEFIEFIGKNRGHSNFEEKTLKNLKFKWNGCNIIRLF